MMPVGEDAVVTFYDHPRSSLFDGRLMAEWPDLRTGRKTSSIDAGSGRRRRLLHSTRRTAGLLSCKATRSTWSCPRA